MATVVVTGGTVRIGKAIADFLRARGWSVITTSHRPDSGADVLADLSRSDGAVRLYSQVLKLNGGLPPDALVNNAALLTGSEAALNMVNVESVKKLTILMAGRESGRGAVVNIVDSQVLGEPRTGESGYLRGKREIYEWTHRAAQMFADTISVGAVLPAAVLAPVGVRMSAAGYPQGPATVQAVACEVWELLKGSGVGGDKESGV